MLETLWYLGVFGFAHSLVIGASTVLAIPVLFNQKKAVARRVIPKIALFNVILLCAGAVGSFIWATVAWHRLYSSLDPLLTYQPFVPFGAGVFHRRPPELEVHLAPGASILQLQLIWCAVTSFVWVATIVVYRFATRCLSAGA
jgi:hypothetical protein